VIDYVKERYGHDAVSQIVTFGTMAARAVIRDVGRVLDLPFPFVDGIAKLIPMELGITLKDAIDKEEQIQQRIKKEEEVKELFDLALKLEGLVRNVGMHAGGVLIAPGKISDYSPLYCQADGDGMISQFDKDDVESVGLIKFDFLGLRTLTILSLALKNANQLRSKSNQKPINLDDIPLDDKETYEWLTNANTTAVFQLESRGMKDMLKQAKPDCFEGIIALVALYRPGPMDLIPDFVERKHGRQRVNFPDERVKTILEETYGIMVYQEQVMQMAQIIGGYSLGGADLLRRAMGKKKPEEMAQHRQLFLEGSKKNGLSEAKSNEIFDLMEKFAGYGFNKSHAAAYALIAYQTAWFKCHYISAFMAANMSASMDDTDRIQHLFGDCIKNKLTLLPPDIHESEYRFVPVSDTQIRYGLGGIRGTGEAAIEHILHVRASGAFESFFDFCCRVDRRIVNKRSVESLIRSGAFDSLDANRSRLLASVHSAIAAAEQQDRDLSQGSLFDDDVVSVFEAAMTEARPWADYEQLQNEKVALGFYYSGHPFKSFEQELSLVVSSRLNAISVPAPGDGVRQMLLAGVVDSTRIQKTNNGRMMIVTISDGYGSEEVVLYDEFLDRFRDLVKEDAIVVFEAKIRSYRRGSELNEASIVSRIAAENVFSLAAVRERFGKTLKLRMDRGADAKQLKTILAQYRDGPIPVKVLYQGPSGEAEIDLGDEWRVRPEDSLFSELSEWLSPEAVSLTY
ncbi:MAG TPA: DNA polymerase III subunit alpha, partial [Betaproteobacteria bacterium]|nr:DNA polymerase III subunit alpha [Betaproteobacteria bacterium]